MNGTMHNLIVDGVMMAPIVGYALGAFAVFQILRPILHRIGFRNWFSNLPIAELSLFVVLLGGVVMLS